MRTDPQVTDTKGRLLPIISSDEHRARVAAEMALNGALGPLQDPDETTPTRYTLDTDTLETTRRFQRAGDGTVPLRRSRRRIEVVASGMRYHSAPIGPATWRDWWEQEAYGLPIDAHRDRPAWRADADTLRHAADEFLRMHGSGELILLGDELVADVDIRPLTHLRLMGTDDVSWQQMVHTHDTAGRAKESDGKHKVRWPATRTKARRNRRRDEIATVDLPPRVGVRRARMGTSLAPVGPVVATAADPTTWTVTALCMEVPADAETGVRFIGNSAAAPYRRQTKAQRAAARAARAAMTEHVTSRDHMALRAAEIAASLAPGTRRAIAHDQAKVTVSRLKTGRLDVTIKIGKGNAKRTSAATAARVADIVRASA